VARYFDYDLEPPSRKLNSLEAFILACFREVLADCNISKSYPLCPRNIQNWQVSSLKTALNVCIVFCHSVVVAFHFSRLG